MAETDISGYEIYLTGPSRAMWTLTSLSSQQVQQELLNSLVLLKGQLEVKIAMMMMVMVVMMMVMGMISIT